MVPSLGGHIFARHFLRLNRRKWSKRLANALLRVTVVPTVVPAPADTLLRILFTRTHPHGGIMGWQKRKRK